MKIAEFVELDVWDADRAANFRRMINLTKVYQIASCGNSKFTRIIFENQIEIIINGKFDAVKMEIKRQLKNEEA